MKIPINSSDALGKVVRASRKAQKIRQDDAAGSIGVSENFLGKVESGSDSVQWENSLRCCKAWASESKWMFQKALAAIYMR